MRRDQVYAGVTVVTVTYGARRKYVESVLEAVEREGVGHIVLVDNGAKWNVRDLESRFCGYLSIVSIDRNLGSAEGFSKGIEVAQKRDAEFIWLLDDDNVPAVGTLTKLVRGYQDSLSHDNKVSVAVTGLRRNLEWRIRAGNAVHRRGSFLSFHVCDVPKKVATRLGLRTTRQRRLPKFASLDMGPYGGLLFHADMLKVVGLPKKEFVLYGDDGEFTHRMTSSGARLLCITDAFIDDIDGSWNSGAKKGSSFNTWLREDSDVKAYYYARNHVWLEKYCLNEHSVAYKLNQWMYMLMLNILAIIWKRRARLRILKEAIRDGKCNRLGVNSKFSLD